MNCLKKCHEKFKITKENTGDKFVITLSGAKEDVAQLEKKLNAMQVLLDDCCGESPSCC